MRNPASPVRDRMGLDERVVRRMPDRLVERLDHRRRPTPADWSRSSRSSGWSNSGGADPVSTSSGW